MGQENFSKQAELPGKKNGIGRNDKNNLKGFGDTNFSSFSSFKSEENNFTAVLKRH